MKYFKLETSFGVSIVRGVSLRSARSAQLKKHGTEHFDNISVATDEDLVRQVKAGGWIPEEIRVYVNILQTPESALRKILLSTLRAIIDKELSEARIIADKSGFKLRVGIRDGKNQIGTADVVPTRINCVVNNNVVIDILSVG